MQTFLTSTSFIQTVADLDSVRLNKQLREGLQTLCALQGVKIHRPSAPDARAHWFGFTPHAWRQRGHPAVCMWERNAHSLAEYLHAMYLGFRYRGGNDNVSYQAQLRELIARDGWDRAQLLSRPWWLQDEQAARRVVSSHRVALLGKAEWRYLMTGDERDLEWYRERALLGRWVERALPDCSAAYAWPRSEAGQWR